MSSGQVGLMTLLVSTTLLGVSVDIAIIVVVRLVVNGVVIVVVLETCSAPLNFSCKKVKFSWRVPRIDGLIDFLVRIRQWDDHRRSRTFLMLVKQTAASLWRCAANVSATLRIGTNVSWWALWQLNPNSQNALICINLAYLRTARLRSATQINVRNGIWWAA